jgi:hypothetical protein
VALTKTSQTYQDIEAAAEDLVYGTVLCIDPSIGSQSSMPGWAIYEAGLLTSSGVLHIDPTGTQVERLRFLGGVLRSLFETFDPDVLVYEKVPVSAHGGGRSQVGHASLLMASGVVLSIPGPDYTVGIMPISWKKLVRPTYRKGDEQDAIEIGYICIEEARKILGERDADEAS